MAAEIRLVTQVISAHHGAYTPGWIVRSWPARVVFTGETSSNVVVEALLRSRLLGDSAPRLLHGAPGDTLGMPVFQFWICCNT
jgi:hypothetical protein